MTQLVSPEQAVARADEPRFERLCIACGYGAIARIAPAAGPVCHGTVWEYVALSVRTTTGKEQS